MRLLRPVTALAGLVLLAACQDAAIPTDARSSAQRPNPEGFPTPGEARTGYVVGTDGKPVQITFQVRQGRAFFEGDIDLGPAERIPATAQEAARETRFVPRLGVIRDGDNARWPNGRVPYVIASTLPKSSRVTSAISHIENNTRTVDFVPRTNERDYVYVVRSNGCASSVGRVGGQQLVYLADGCSTGNTIHELSHALGVYHEQTRCDRDTYVLVNLQNVIKGYEGNFTKQCNGASDVFSYDEGSIMHYGPYDFSSNGLPVLVSLRGLDRLMGQRSGLSASDVKTIDAMYP